MSLADVTAPLFSRSTAQVPWQERLLGWQELFLPKPKNIPWPTGPALSSLIYSPVSPHSSPLQTVSQPLWPIFPIYLINPGRSPLLVLGTLLESTFSTFYEGCLFLIVPDSAQWSPYWDIPGEPTYLMGLPTLYSHTLYHNIFFVFSLSFFSSLTAYSILMCYLPPLLLELSNVIILVPPLYLLTREFPLPKILHGT